ncbi:MAG TPA: hypothetical protein VM008_16605 [Phycisphaerae bacterium]|nr:hypothetical protein [Phycisphaerae bacterium]
MITSRYSLSHVRPRTSKLSQLVKRRRQLASQLEKLEGQIAALGASGSKAKAISAATLDRILDELAQGKPPLKSLPVDFSRADIYDDHD